LALLIKLRINMTDENIKTILDRLDHIAAQLKRTESFDEKFSNYQIATQRVVQLAFALIASFTVTVIITSIFKR